jgi:hypothetical protein
MRVRIGSSGGARFARHAARRANARAATSEGRIAVRGKPLRCNSWQPRRVAPRFRPEASVKPDYLPIAVH